MGSWARTETEERGPNSKRGNSCHCTGFAESSPGTTHVAQGAVLSVNKCHQGALREAGGDPRDTVMEEKGSVL